MENLKTSNGPSLSAGVGLLSHFSGMAVYQSTMAVTREQYRFPKSKKKRIRKKWAKRPENFWNIPGAYITKVPVLAGFGVSQVEERLIIHPVLFAKLQDQLKREQETYERKWR